jgi:hypothetical protein
MFTCHRLRPGEQTRLSSCHGTNTFLAPGAESFRHFPLLPSPSVVYLGDDGMRPNIESALYPKTCIGPVTRGGGLCIREHSRDVLMNTQASKRMFSTGTAEW